MKNILFLLLALFFACNNKQQKLSISKDTTTQKVVVDTAAKPAFTIAMMSYKRDLACGMPLSAGLSDTCHYKNKVYGFCSIECKEAFLKSPATYIAAIKKG